jgi:peptidoglycan hydrolase-like protein with peptidoglycan-binding domain
MGMTMTGLIRKTVLGAASVLALGFGGAALDWAVDPGNVANAGSIAAAPQNSNYILLEGRIWKGDVRWAQVELRHNGLYGGSLDGVLGSQTKEALRQFQQARGLAQTASLDAPTWKALTGHAEIGQGSGTPPSANSYGTSDAGR